MQRAAAAKWHQHEIAGIMPALDRDQPDCAGHAGVGDAHDRIGRRHHVEAERSPTWISIASRAASTSSRASLPPIGLSAVDAAEHDIGVRQGRARRRRRHSRPARAASPRSPGPTCSRPPVSTCAIEPPPAPIVVISIIGVRMTRPKSIVSAPRARLRRSRDQRTSNEVPPRSRGDHVRNPAARAIAQAAMTPAAGPESAVRTGNRARPPADMTPPFDCTIWNSPLNRCCASARLRAVADR